MNKIKIKNFSVATWYDAKKKTSFCWHYFGDLVLEEHNKKKKIFTKQVFCNVCLSNAKDENDDITFGLVKIKSYSKTVSTGNLNGHLRDFHKIQEATRNINEVLEIHPKAIVTATTVKASTVAAANISPVIKKEKDTRSLERDMVLWFCRSLMPFDSVSDEGMIAFFLKYDIISTRDDMPSRETISRTALNDVYDSMLKNIKAQITTDAIRHAAITFDLWTDRCRQLNYITFMLHYLTVDFELKTFTLSTKLIEGKTSGEIINELLNSTKEYFGLQEIELHFVTDAVSNIKRAILLAGLDSHLCLGQGLHNLVTVDGIRSVPETEELVIKITKIFKTIRLHLADLERQAEEEQIQFLQEIEHLSETLDSDENDPIVDSEFPESNDEESGSFMHKPTPTSSTPTRWHIVLAMLECIANSGSRSPVNNMMSQIGEEGLKIYRQEWNLLEDLIRFLRKFSEAIQILSAQQTASLNLALVFLLEVKDILNSLSDEESPLMLKLKTKMLAKIDERFPITDKIVIAALLDPRFVGLSEINKYLQRKNTSRAAFLSEYIQKQVDILNVVTLPDPLAPASSSNESVLTKLSRKYSSGTRSLAVKSEVLPGDQECWQYLTTATANGIQGDDIFTYWLEKKSTFPLLSELARAVLAIPATSKPSERAFSTADLILNAKRSRLSPVHVDKMIFVHENYKLYKEN